MSDRIVSGEIRHAAKEYDCVVCTRRILVGERHIAHYVANRRGGKGTGLRGGRLRVDRVCAGCWLDTADERARAKMRPPGWHRIRKHDGRRRFQIYLAGDRAKGVGEIVAWAGHSRPTDVVYSMIDASIERWRKLRDEGMLPARPTQKLSRSGPKIVKVPGV